MSTIAKSDKERDVPDPARILVVEDERNLAAGIKLNLELEGYSVDVVDTAREAAARLVDADDYDAIYLDVMLPDLDGFEFCKRVRESGNFIPVIMVTARSAAEDRVAGLEAGADDYMVKPFDLAELLARFRSMLRRQAWQKPTTGSPVSEVLEFGRARIDFGAHDVVVAGEAKSLTRLELDLLRYLSARPQRVVSRDELLEQVWKLRNYSSTRTVDNFIVRLRRHFEEQPTSPKHFISVRGAGYKFVP